MNCTVSPTDVISSISLVLVANYKTCLLFCLKGGGGVKMSLKVDKLGENSIPNSMGHPSGNVRPAEKHVWESCGLER